MNIWARRAFPHRMWETDFAFRKAACDVVAQGAAYTPGGKPAERVRVGLRVGDWTKQFDVVGPRQWRTLGPSITATKPFPFTRLAFGYDTAFGGPDRSRADEKQPPVYADNPYGLGFATVRAGSRIDGLDLPLTEAVDDPVTSPFGAHRPMALGPIARVIPARSQYAGTYDDNWKDNIFPLPAARFRRTLLPMRPRRSADCPARPRHPGPDHRPDTAGTRRVPPARHQPAGQRSFAAASWHWTASCAPTRWPSTARPGSSP